jgi:hypothetical protein
MHDAPTYFYGKYTIQRHLIHFNLNKFERALNRP